MTDEIANRRSFFRLAARETVVRADELRGKPQLRLADLSTLPDEQLVRLVPKIVQGVSILSGVDQVRARLPNQNEPVVLFPADRASLAIFNRFNGYRTLRQAADEAGEEQGWDEATRLSRTKALFLRLVRLGVCMPNNAPDLPVPARTGKPWRLR